MHEGNFGSCCQALSDAMTTPPNSLFRVETNGVMYLTIGYTQTERGVGWFEQALIFCPFCGAQLQDREDARQKSASLS